MQFLGELNALPTPVDPVSGRTPGLRLYDFAPSNEQGLPLFEPLTLTLTPRERLLLRCPSGVGKTTLLLSLTGLWPQQKGSAELDRDGLLILPQRPLSTLGSMYELLHFTGEASAFDVDEARLAAVLKLTEFLHLPLHSSNDWNRRLIPGEQQRLVMSCLDHTATITVPRRGHLGPCRNGRTTFVQSARSHRNHGGQHRSPRKPLQIPHLLD